MGNFRYRHWFIPLHYVYQWKRIFFLSLSKINNLKFVSNGHIISLQYSLQWFLFIRNLFCQIHLPKTVLSIISNYMSFSIGWERMCKAFKFTLLFFQAILLTYFLSFHFIIQYENHTSFFQNSYFAWVSFDSFYHFGHYAYKVRLSFFKMEEKWILKNALLTDLSTLRIADSLINWSEMVKCILLFYYFTFWWMISFFLLTYFVLLSSYTTFLVFW
jgi:hypothetical protein